VIWLCVLIIKFPSHVTYKKNRFKLSLTPFSQVHSSLLTLQSNKLPWIWKQYVSPKYLYLSMRLQFLIQNVEVFNFHCQESLITSISRPDEYLLVQVMKFACRFSNTNIFAIHDQCPLHTVREHFLIANTSTFSYFVAWGLR